MNIATQQACYLDVQLSERGVAELKEGRQVLFVPRDEVQHLELHRGSPAERPLIQAAAGIVFAGFGLFIGLHIVSGGLTTWRYSAGFLLCGGLGAWLLWETLQRKHYLLVTCRNDARKFVFRGSVDESALSHFMQQANGFGYIVEDPRFSLKSSH
jgi:hypothetical protein